LRILYFTRDYTPHDHRFLSSLAKTDHEVFSLRLERRSRQLEDRALPYEVQQVQWKGGHGPVGWRDYPVLWLDLKRVLRTIKPDLIHAGPIPNVAFLAALSGFQPLVSMSWGSDLLRDVDQHKDQRWAARYALRHTKVLVGDCLAVRRKAVNLGFPAERVVLFPWGVDLEEFSPPGNEEYPGDFRMRTGWQDAFVVLSLRSWEPVYGVDVVVRGFVLAAQKIPDLRMILLGGGSQTKLILDTIRRSGMEERVYVGGQVKNSQLPGFYQAADLYLSASHSDGSSVSLMEALACGRPVLVSDISGNREWIENSSAGQLFPDGDEAALADGIVMAYRQRQELLAMQQAARQLAEERADWNKNFQKLLGAYEMAME
jgi:glycosyltransferase involved in cell wall biosynthesis